MSMFFQCSIRAILRFFYPNRFNNKSMYSYTTLHYFNVRRHSRSGLSHKLNHTRHTTTPNKTLRCTARTNTKVPPCPESMLEITVDNSCMDKHTTGMTVDIVKLHYAVILCVIVLMTAILLTFLSV